MANVRRAFDRYVVQYTSSKRNLPLASITCFDGAAQVGLLEFVEPRHSSASRSFTSRPG
jgi:hypothetical protein